MFRPQAKSPVPRIPFYAQIQRADGDIRPYEKSVTCSAGFPLNLSGHRHPGGYIHSGAEAP